MALRLTEAQRADRRLTGSDLQRQIAELAVIYGWSWVHFRPAQTARGWRTPVEGPLGHGWPDLVLVHPGKRRLMFVEVKRELGDEPTDEQLWVHGQLLTAGQEVHVWRPSDMTSGRIQSVLAGGTSWTPR